MNIKELIAAVESETGRPDLTSSGLIGRTVRSTILRAHKKEFFIRDIVEDLLKGLKPESTTLVMNLPPLWRKFSVLRPVDSSGVPLVEKLTYRDIDDVFTAKGVLEQNIYYVSGASFTINTPTVIENLYCAFWQLPDLSNELKATWITEQYDQMIIDGACEHVYRKTGNDKSAKAHKSLWEEQVAENLMQNLIGGE